MTGAMCAFGAEPGGPHPPESTQGIDVRPVHTRLSGPARWLALPVLTGVLLILAFPPYDLGWLAWIAPAPLFAHLLSGARRPLLAAFVSAAVFFLGLIAWFRHFAWEGYLAAVAILGGLWCVMALLVRLAPRGGPAWSVCLVAASGWTVLEWFRSQGQFGFGWGGLAATQHRALPLIQLLEWTGPYGLTLLMAFTAAALALAALGRPGGGRALALSVCLAAVIWARGWLVLQSAPPTVAGPAIAAGVVQASSALPSRGSVVETQGSLEEYTRLTRLAVAHGARLVFWPETTLPDDLTRWPGVRAQLASLLPPGAALVGGGFETDERTGATRNSALSLAPGGWIRDRYTKVNLVPFGEYVPARPLFFWIDRYGAPSTDQVRGEGLLTIEAAGQQIGVSICFESSFPGPSREFTRRGATLLAVLTSDGWSGRASAAVQHAAMAPLRAVENRRSMARAAATGISARIDPYGRTRAQVPLFQRDIAVAALPLRTDLTWYTRLGDLPVWLCLVVLVSAAIARLATRARSSPAFPG